MNSSDRSTLFPLPSLQLPSGRQTNAGPLPFRVVGRYLSANFLLEGSSTGGVALWRLSFLVFKGRVGVVIVLIKLAHLY